MSDPPIQFHEDEYFYSPLSDEVLRLIALFVDRDTYDKLLYRGATYVRCYFRNPSRRMEKRIQLNRIRYGRVRLIEATQSEETVTPLYPLASGG